MNDDLVDRNQARVVSEQKEAESIPVASFFYSSCRHGFPLERPLFDESEWLTTDLDAPTASS